MNKIVSDLLRLVVLPIVAIGITLFLLWVNPQSDKTYLYMTQLWFVAIVFPVYLAIVNYILSLKYSKIYWGYKSVTVVLSMLIVSSSSYLGWGIGTGYLLNPSYLTVDIVIIGFEIGVVVSSVSLVLSSFVAIRAIRRNTMKSEQPSHPNA